MQTTTSANTSTNQVPRTYNILLKQGIIGNGEKLFDYGCGKYLHTIQEHAAANGYSVVGYDPYNQTEQDNDRAVSVLHTCNAIVCNNVLNVIDNNTVLHDICKGLAILSHINNITVYICVYTGNGTGKGAYTKPDCYQRNSKTPVYKPILEKYFPKVTIKHGIIACSW